VSSTCFESEGSSSGRRLYIQLRYGTVYMCGPGSSVGIANDYGLVGPGPNPGGDEIFRPSRPALGSIQPPVKWVPGFSRGINCGRGVLLTTHPLLVPHRACNSITLPFLPLRFTCISISSIEHSLSPTRLLNCCM